MANAVMLINFKLADGVSEADFLQTTEKVHNEFMSKQKGYISWRQLLDCSGWADMITWETMDDAKNAISASENDAASGAFFAMLDMESVKIHIYEVKKDYNG